MRTLLTPLLLAAVASAETPRHDPRFDLELFARLAAAEGNVACSPFSVRVALALAQGGARGATAEEMARVLRLGPGGHDEIAELLRRMQGEQVAVANALWLQAGDPILPAYLDLARTRYGAVPESLDFAGAPDAAAARINRWVAGKTHDRIRDIVAADQFNPNTSLVLTNALYFRAPWLHAFSGHGTKPRPFTLASGEAVDVPTMRQRESLPYFEGEGVQAVELPYAGGRFGMLLVLREGDLDAAGLRAVVDGLEPAPVDLSLPRFRFESGFRLDAALKAMGMETAFGRDADFSGVNGREDLFIAFVNHRAFIAVDEKGTEAAAATAVGLERKGEREPPRVFRADRPFLFCIRERETGTILFLGRVADPRG